jgi:hypothetical protein
MYSLSILECPNGRYMFVGSVPPQLAVETNDPSLIEVGARCGLGLAHKIAERRGKYIRTRTWDSLADAAAEAARLGYEIA